MQVASSSLDIGATLDTTAEKVQEGKNVIAETTLLVDLASVQLRQGQFSRSRDTCLQALDLVSSNQQLAGSSKVYGTAAGLLALIEVCHCKPPTAAGLDAQPDVVPAC